MIATDETAKYQIERILNSEPLRSSEGLRRLLRFLADKAVDGSADQLKEYTIGIDAFGKSATYDPRHDSTVRIQVGRLRQKLAEYYQGEGKDDPVVVELPKGHYKLSFQFRTPGEPVSGSAGEAHESAEPRGAKTGNARRWLVPALVACLIAAGAWAVYATIRLRTEYRTDALLRAEWTPEVAAIWGPFVDSPRPLVVSISAPMFVAIPGIGVFRDEKVNHREDIPKSESLAAISKALGAKADQTVYYGTLGGATSSFILGKVLAPRKADVALVSGKDLTWRQVSENNVVFIGSPRFFEQKLSSMPVKTDFYVEPGVGIRNVNRRPNEPEIFKDDRTFDTGTTWSLVSRIPGPQGNTDVMSFTGTVGAGIAAAVSSFTEPATAREMVAKLRKASGEMPRYYQMLLKVRFQDGVPLETSCVLHHELQANGP